MNAQSCEPIPAANLMARLSGRRILAIDVRTLSPDLFPGVPAIAGKLHVRSHAGTVRRELLVAPLDLVDTLRLTESLRKLRRLRYLADVRLEASGCQSPEGVRLTVTTRDAWSTIPTLTVRAVDSAVVGIQESNLFGSGRSARLYARADGSRFGLGLGYSDPWLFGSNLAATVSRNVYRDGRDWRVSLGTHPRSVFDRWRAQADVARAFRQSSRTSVDTVRRETAHVLVSRRIAASTASVTSLLVGVEVERTSLASPDSAPIVGPARVRRSFVGIDLGLALHTARYDTLSWYLPTHEIADLPRGYEGEGIVGVGRDLALQRPALHFDLWGGRMWMPIGTSLLVGDAWASGFLRDGALTAASARLAVSAYRAAPRGTWSARVAAEVLNDPDPDVRTLASFDPTFRAIPGLSRLAEAAVAGSLERTLHLVGVGREYVLDGAILAATSVRWSPVAPSTDHVAVSVLATGLRLAPTHLGRATLRLDIGYPVFHSAEARTRPFYSISFSPWLETGRRRAADRSP